MLEENTYNKGEEDDYVIEWEAISLEEWLETEADWGAIIQAVDQNYLDMEVDDPIKEIERLQWSQNLEKYEKKKYDLWNPNDCEYESGYYAVEQLVERLAFDNRKDDRGKTTDDYANSLKDLNVTAIKETKRILLEKAYEALHPQCPLRRLYCKTQFGIMWEDFDHRIVCQIINTLKPRREDGILKYTKFPAHLIILAQGVYTELINEKDFQPTDLRIYDEYVNYDTFLGEKRYEPRLAKVSPSDFQLQLRGKDGKPNQETLDFLSDKKKQLMDTETLKFDKKMEKWTMYLEHDQWVQEFAPDDYKKAWERDKAQCRKRLLNNNIKNTHGAIVVWAIDKLKQSWLAKGVPIFPNQKLVKEYLYKVEPHRFDEAYGSKDFWKRPIDVARQWTYFPPAKMKIKS